MTEQLNQQWTSQRPHEMEIYHTRALEAFPYDEPQVAFNKFIHQRAIEDIPFIDADEQRCIWRSSLDYTHSKRYKGSQKCQVDLRTFYYRSQELSLRRIDAPKALKVRNLVQHTSEHGWNLPVSHDRHFFQFPEEIRVMILNHVVTVSQDVSILPHTVSSNWVSASRINPDYRLAEQSVVESRAPAEGEIFVSPRWVVWRMQQDHKGVFWEMRQVRRKEIDATALRVCKDWRRHLSKALYRDNKYNFDMCNNSSHDCPPSLFPGYELFQPNPVKPPHEEAAKEQWNRDVAEVIRNVWNRVDITFLAGYVYYDPFIRFLYTIGPFQASLLKNLTFRGSIRIHPRGQKPCRYKCDDCIVESLRLYIPFIASFCTRLETLTLCVGEDTIAARDPNQVEPGSPTCVREALVPILENEFHQIRTLKHLAVLDYDGDAALDFARPTVRWVKQNAAQRLRDTLEEDEAKRAAEAVRSENVHCAYCGEGHLWPNCYNLCSFCGAFGHFRPTCPKPRAADYDRDCNCE